MTEDPRAAGTRQPDRLASGLDAAQIVQATRNEIATTHRVYRKDWLHAGRHAEKAGAEAVAGKFEGRLEDGDLRIEEDGDSWILWTRRWNVESEWKTVQLAQAHASELSDSVEVVARNSRREVQLQNYGVLKLVR